MKMLISGLELHIENAGETFGMGGPWIGDLWLGTDLISKDCIADNFVYWEEHKRMLFVKFHGVSNGHRVFTINFFNVDTKLIYEFKLAFDAVHLGRFVGQNRLKIYNAFHDHTEKSLVINLDEQEFIEVK